MNIYTLKNRETGEKGKALNGKMFKVAVNYFVVFVDINTGKVCWTTTDVVNYEYTGDGVIFTTKNSKYELVNVLNILPSSDTERE